MKIPFLAALSAAALVAACNSGTKAPAEDAAVETTETMVAETAEAPAMPTDQTTAAQAAEQQAAADQAGLPATRQTRASFACDNDEKIEVRFFPEQGIAVLVRGGENIELQQEPAGSGFKYSNGQTMIQGKGDELTLQVGMMAATKCTAS